MAEHKGLMGLSIRTVVLPDGEEVVIENNKIEFEGMDYEVEGDKVLSGNDVIGTIVDGMLEPA